MYIHIYILMYECMHVCMYMRVCTYPGAGELSLNIKETDLSTYPMYIIDWGIYVRTYVLIAWDEG